MSDRLDPLTTKYLRYTLATINTMSSDDEGCRIGQHIMQLNDTDSEDEFDALAGALAISLVGNVRPPVSIPFPPVDEPWVSLDPTIFKENCRFFPIEFLHVCEVIQLPVNEDQQVVSPNR